MDTKDYLNQAYILEQQIRRCECQRQAALDRATDITSHLRDVRVQTSTPSDSTMAVMTEIAMDLEKKISDKRKRLAEVRAEIEKTIDTIEDSEIKYILKMRYLCYFSWPDIAHQTYCSEAKIYRLHREGIKMLTVRDS